MSVSNNELMPPVYDELRRIAARYMSRERPGQTLQATALVNEAFVRLAAERTRHFQNRTHFLAIACDGQGALGDGGSRADSSAALQDVCSSWSRCVP